MLLTLCYKYSIILFDIKIKKFSLQGCEGREMQINGRS